MSGFAAGDLVDFIQKDDAARFHALKRGACHQLHVYQLLLFFLHQVIQRLGHPHFAPPGLGAEQVGQHIFQIDAHLFQAGVGGDLERRRAVFDLQLHQALIQLAFPQALAEFFARALGAFAGVRSRRHQQVQQPVFGIHFRPVGHLVEPFLAHHVDGDVHQVADHRLHVAPHVAHFRELAGFYFQERRVGQARQAPRQLRLAHARGADHENVLGHHFIGHLGRKFLPADAVTQRDRHRALGFRLTHHVFVQFADDLARGQLVQQRLLIHGLPWKIDHHAYSSSS